MFDLHILSTVVAPVMRVSGEVIIAVVVLSVHLHVAEERKIDDEVIRYMRKEQIAVVFGIVLIITGFALEFFLS